MHLLWEELEELSLQIQSGKKIEEDLRKQYNETIDRVRGSDSKHNNMLKERELVLKKHEVEKANYIEKNKEVASRYRQLQNDYVITKEKMLQSYDERVKIEATITDIKQLQSLQSKLHGALAEYFKLSGLYNESELLKLERESSENGERVGELQVNMECALDDISAFITDQMDGQVARKIAMDAVREKSIVVPVVPPIPIKKESVSTSINLSKASSSYMKSRATTTVQWKYISKVI